MRELLILFGALIGWVLGYVFRLYAPGKVKKEEPDRQQELTEAKNTIRHLEAQLDQYQNLQEQLNACETQLQQKTEELESVHAKFTSAEAQIETLQQRIASLEQQVQAEIPTPQAEMPPEETPQAIEAETVSAEVPPAAEPEPVRSVTEKADNLRKIEGIGPKVAQLLNGSGVLTFAQLAQTEVDRLRAILEDAGPPFKGMDPASWPEQAALAAKEDWDALKTLQDQLDGGRYKS